MHTHVFIYPYIHNYKKIQCKLRKEGVPHAISFVCERGTSQRGKKTNG